MGVKADERIQKIRDEINKEKTKELKTKETPKEPKTEEA